MKISVACRMGAVNKITAWRAMTKAHWLHQVKRSRYHDEYDATRRAGLDDSAANVAEMRRVEELGAFTYRNRIPPLGRMAAGKDSLPDAFVAFIGHRLTDF